MVYLNDVCDISICVYYYFVLQCLIEQVMVLRRAVEQLSGSTPPLQTGVLSSVLGRYAEILATQGSLNSAVTYLVDPNEVKIKIKSVNC